VSPLLKDAWALFRSVEAAFSAVRFVSQMQRYEDGVVVWMGEERARGTKSLHPHHLHAVLVVHQRVVRGDLCHHDRRRLQRAHETMMQDKGKK
jgi:hypothetical protein